LSLLLFPTAQASELRLLSFNTYMLPRPIKKSLQGVRAEAIAHALKSSDYDIIVLQEAFTPWFRRTIRRELAASYPHRHYLAKRVSRRLFGSGLYLLSKYPFKVIDYTFFNSCGGADCYADKGAVLIEAHLPSGVRFQLVNTHLQAIESLGHVRLKQLAQIKKMLTRHAKNNVPQILVGDLNIDVTEPEFEEGLALLGMGHAQLVGPITHTNARVGPCFPGSAKDPEWVDHFWSNDAGVNKTSVMRVKVIDFKHAGRECPASDHHAIETTFSFSH
jgi:endonuclease/exonuclease/phosphatase family metal-dependent hydrolase